MTDPVVVPTSSHVVQGRGNDLDVVRLAAAHYRAEGQRLSLARSSLGLNSTAFYAAVNRAIDDPQVEAALPVEVHRLRRLRAQRQRPGTRRLAA